MSMMEERLFRSSLYFSMFLLFHRNLRHIPLTFELLKENLKLRVNGIWSENGLESTAKNNKA